MCDHYSPEISEISCHFLEYTVPPHPPQGQAEGLPPPPHGALRGCLRKLNLGLSSPPPRRRRIYVLLPLEIAILSLISGLLVCVIVVAARVKSLS